ncbi:MAG: Uma2 family endonuclease [Chloroflexi bacterium]|nr:Uma2 family endonuclease [Chloroflexota bacterium]
MDQATIFFSTKRFWTDNELMSLPNDGRKYELIEGELLMSPVGMTHSLICVELVALLTRFVQRKKIGAVFDSSMGFRLSRRLLLSPDVSYVSKARLKEIMVAPEKFLYGAPDLAVEVFSPSDTLDIIERKLDQYFHYGTRLAWVVDPQRRTVSVHALDAVTKLSRSSDTLGGGEVLPGFKCKLGRIFDLD